MSLNISLYTLINELNTDDLIPLNSLIFEYFIHHLLISLNFLRNDLTLFLHIDSLLSLITGSYTCLYLTIKCLPNNEWITSLISVLIKESLNCPLYIIRTILLNPYILLYFVSLCPNILTLIVTRCILYSLHNVLQFILFFFKMLLSLMQFLFQLLFILNIL